MNHSLHTILLCLVLMCSCNATKLHTEQSEFAPLYFEKTACYGVCPAFVFEWNVGSDATLVITRPFRDGPLAQLELGSYTANTDVKERASWHSRIQNDAEIAEYGKLNAVYDNTMVTDLPSTITVIEGHRVTNRYKGPDLSKLYNSLESAMEALKWKPIQ